MRVVMLTGQLSVQALAEAAEAGAAACLSLNAHVRDLAEAVRADTTDTMLVDPTSLSAPAQARQVEVAGQVVTDLAVVNWRCCLCWRMGSARPRLPPNW